jgi:hypothetical protein
MRLATRLFVLTLIAGILTATLACKEEVPLEGRTLTFLNKITQVLKTHADNPEAAAKEIKALTTEQGGLLKEIRAVTKREKTGGGATISEDAEEKLQAAIGELMKATMNEQLMAHKPLHEALKELLQ